MSIATLQKLLALWEAEERNFNIVEERLRRAGRSGVDPVITSSLARYYDALQKLSAE